MRRVGLSDLDVAARTLMQVNPDQRAALAEKLILDAHAADLWRKRHGSAHPAGGTGSLYAQAFLLSRAPSSDCTSEYCSAMTTVLHALRRWRMRGHKDW